MIDAGSRLQQLPDRRQLLGVGEGGWVIVNAERDQRGVEVDLAFRHGDADQCAQETLRTE